MNRRDFLKALSVAATALVVPVTVESVMVIDPAVMKLTQKPLYFKGAELIFDHTVESVIVIDPEAVARLAEKGRKDYKWVDGSCSRKGTGIRSPTTHRQWSA